MNAVLGIFLTSLHKGDTGRTGSVWLWLGMDVVQNRWVQTVACHTELRAALRAGPLAKGAAWAQPLEEAHLWPTGSWGLGLSSADAAGVGCPGSVEGK